MIHDLIYADNEQDYADIQALILKQYPTAKFEDGSDDIHQYRFSLEIDVDQTEDDYLVWAIVNGLINVSMTVNLVVMGDIPRARRLLDLVKAARTKGKG